MTAFENSDGNEHSSNGQSLELADADLGDVDLDNLGAKVPAEWKEELAVIAYERSEPPERVNTSDLVREALYQQFSLSHPEDDE